MLCSLAHHPSMLLASAARSKKSSEKRLGYRLSMTWRTHTDTDSQPNNSENFSTSTLPNKTTDFSQWFLMSWHPCRLLSAEAHGRIRASLVNYIILRKMSEQKVVPGLHT